VLVLCDPKIEKPYYSARIYSDTCIECGCLNINKPAKDEYSRCSDCGSTSTNPKKSSIRTKNKK
ncbi:2760_t:CDS:1, partial [Gigaspora margarita]